MLSAGSIVCFTIFFGKKCRAKVVIFGSPSTVLGKSSKSKLRSAVWQLFFQVKNVSDVTPVPLRTHFPKRGPKF